MYTFYVIQPFPRIIYEERCLLLTLLSIQHCKGGGSSQEKEKKEQNFSNTMKIYLQLIYLAFFKTFRLMN